MFAMNISQQVEPIILSYLDLKGVASSSQVSKEWQVTASQVIRKRDDWVEGVKRSKIEWAERQVLQAMDRLITQTPSEQDSRLELIIEGMRYPIVVELRHQRSKAPYSIGERISADDYVTGGPSVIQMQQVVGPFINTPFQYRVSDFEFSANRVKMGTISDKKGRCTNIHYFGMPGFGHRAALMKFPTSLPSSIERRMVPMIEHKLDLMQEAPTACHCAIA